MFDSYMHAYVLVLLCVSYVTLFMCSVNVISECTLNSHICIEIHLVMTISHNIEKSYAFMVDVINLCKTMSNFDIICTDVVDIFSIQEASVYKINENVSCSTVIFSFQFGDCLYYVL